MLEARKENKVYKINEAQKNRYLNEGFDIYKNGVVVEHTPKKMIRYSDHLKEVEKAKAGNIANDVTALLKQYAEAKGIDIGSSTAATGILEKILKAEKTEE